MQEQQQQQMSTNTTSNRVNGNPFQQMLFLSVEPRPIRPAGSGPFVAGKWPDQSTNIPSALLFQQQGRREGFVEADDDDSDHSDLFEGRRFFFLDDE
jgi:hypothetical protein